MFIGDIKLRAYMIGELFLFQPLLRRHERSTDKLRVWLQVCRTGGRAQFEPLCNGQLIYDFQFIIIFQYLGRRQGR